VEDGAQHDEECDTIAPASNRQTSPRSMNIEYCVEPGAAVTEGGRTR